MKNLWIARYDTKEKPISMFELLSAFLTSMVRGEATHVGCHRLRTPLKPKDFPFATTHEAAETFEKFFGQGGRAVVCKGTVIFKI